MYFPMIGARLSWTFDADVHPTLMHPCTGLARGGDRERGHRAADRIRECDVTDDPPSEESVGAMPSAIDELIRNDDVGRVISLFHRSDRAGRDDGVHSQNFESENVRAIVELTGQLSVTAAVPREKGDPNPVDLADDIGIGRLAERRVELMLIKELQPFHVVEPGAPDDSNGDLVHGRHFLIESSMEAATS